jgi:hypothetical protein
VHRQITVRAGGSDGKEKTWDMPIGCAPLPPRQCRPRRTVTAWCGAIIVCGVIGPLPAAAKPLAVEKEEIKLGFIKLTDMAPLAIAYEKQFFEDEGLFVTLEPQANWKVCWIG